MQGQTMKLRKMRIIRTPELRAVAFILLWVISYFNIYRFAAVQSVGQNSSIIIKLVSFSIFVIAVLYTSNGIYKNILANPSKEFHQKWFFLDFIFSMVFAIVCSNKQLLFRLLSAAIFVFDRLFYSIAYRNKFRRKRIHL
jgi:small basic protein